MRVLATDRRRRDAATTRPISPRPVALVVGSEGSGLAEAVLRRAAARLRIPLAPPVESLNVGVAAGLVLFEAARQRGFAPSRGAVGSRA